MMKQIFENAKEPLYGQVTSQIHLKPFDVSTLKEILHDYYPQYASEDLLAFYMITGEVGSPVKSCGLRINFGKPIQEKRYIYHSS